MESEVVVSLVELEGRSTETEEHVEPQLFALQPIGGLVQGSQSSKLLTKSGARLARKRDGPASTSW
jgi:hypothetical protein